MSSGGAFGGAKGYQPRPPEKGVFPLDHFGECKHIKEKYLACLKEHKTDATACREIAKQYLECRMDRNLMAPQDLRDLGFNDTKPSTGNTSPPSMSKQKEEQERKESKGFVAGLHQFKDR